MAMMHTPSSYSSGKQPVLMSHYAAMDSCFYSKVAPTQVADPGLIRINTQLADFLNIDANWLQSAEGLSVLSGNAVLKASTPIATVYAGHQFGHWNPQLGDGRAILLGEVNAQDGQLYDIQLKGSGITPYSRSGDGRSPLGPVLREYIISEAMAQFNIPTSRSLAAVTSGEGVMRDRYLPGAILTRVAKSHIRIGTFQFFAAQKNTQALKELADFVISRHYPHCVQAKNPYLALFEIIVEKQAKLIAQWQLVGFIHGVMNTDNMLLSGETIDYGPCAFMDEYNKTACFSSIDRYGRYNYSSQPEIALWNLSCLAQTFVPLIDDNEELAIQKLHAVLDTFNGQYEYNYYFGLHEKLGLDTMTENSQRLVDEFLALMAENQTDFTLSFRHLTDLADRLSINEQHQAVPYRLPEKFAQWLEQWQSLLVSQQLSVEKAYNTMNYVNPVFIPRNHLVEEAIVAATNENNFQLFHDLVDVLASPYQYLPEKAAYIKPPRAEQRVEYTFCGT